MGKIYHRISAPIALFFLLFPLCAQGASLGKCYKRTTEGIEISYLGGYPSAKRIHSKVQGADPASFRLLADIQGDNCGQAPLYGADAKQVFFRNKPLAGADPKYFIVIGRGYGHDRTGLYYRDKLVANIKPEGIRLIPIPYSTAVYCATTAVVLSRNKPIVAAVDPLTVQALGGRWLRDAEHVYLEHFKKNIQGADPNSFTVLAPRKGRLRDLLYAQDRNRVYMLTAQGVKILQGADPATFERLNKRYCRDRSTVYYKGMPVEGAHAPSFHIPKRTFGHTGFDKFGKIHRGKRVAGK
ncbi:MAG: DKNYY domain-containing protein [Candidatus Electrothrix aestuarii]|uniref:DKNYY domain-containing protein n=1 Tax=Candidatus Electrothrix aestuarii TaxID=3062594 RepID=A0AAU8LRT3_9BACT